jgi:hypothetical protein
MPPWETWETPIMHSDFASITRRVAISRADPISGGVTVVAAFTRHRAWLRHNSFHGIHLVGVVRPSFSIAS